MSTNKTNNTISQFTKLQVVTYNGVKVTILKVFFSEKDNCWCYEIRNNVSQGVVKEIDLSI